MGIKQAVRKLVFPGTALVIVLSLFSFPFVFFVLYTHNTDRWYAYISFLLSAYSLLTLIAAICRSARKLTLDSPLIGTILSDSDKKAMMTLRISALISISYAAFKGITGILFFLPFQISGAVYFAVASIIRIMLIRHKGRPDEEKAATTAILMMLLLDACMIAMVIHAVLWLEGTSYPGYLIYAAAMYSFYAVISAIRNLIIYRSNPSPAIKVSKLIALSVALLSIYSLQTAMFDSFGGNEAFQKCMNALIGTIVSAANIIPALYLVLRNLKKS